MDINHIIAKKASDLIYKRFQLYVVLATCDLCYHGQSDDLWYGLLDSLGIKVEAIPRNIEERASLHGIITGREDYTFAYARNEATSEWECVGILMCDPCNDSCILIIPKEIILKISVLGVP